MGLHKDLTGADLHVAGIHADTHVVAGTDPLVLAESQVTALVTDLSAKVETINVMNYGAIGDGVADDTTAVQAAITALADNQTLYLPAGTYLVNGVTLTADGTRIIMMGTLVPLTTSTPYVLKITGATTVTGNVKIDSGEIGSSYPDTVGLWMFNANQNGITVDVRGVGTGLLVQGDGAIYGCCYNKFWILMIYDCLTSIKAIGTNHGWSNENTYYGGRFGNNSAWPDYSGVLFFDIGMNDYWEADSNHFIHPSIEGHGKLCILRGSGHFIENARIEMASTTETVDKFVEIIGGINNNNKVSCIYDTMAFYRKVLTATVTRISRGVFTIDDSLGDVSGYFTHGKNIALTLSDTSKVDALIERASSYVAGVGTTFHLSADVPALSIISLTVDNYYLNSALNTVQFMQKKFADGSPLQPNSAMALYATPYLPALTILDENASSDIVLQTFYIDAVALTLYADGRIETVKDVGVGRNLVLGGVIISDSVGTVPPTTGAHLRGEIMFYAYPLTGQYIGYTCTASGTPGTWKGFGFIGGTIPETLTAPQFRLSALNTAPANAGDTGTPFEIRITADAIYVCIATNTWVKTALATWA